MITKRSGACFCPFLLVLTLNLCVGSQRSNDGEEVMSKRQKREARQPGRVARASEGQDLSPRHDAAS